jgi:signal transduction histidine kinase/CheY-like chemotaxis protein
MSPALNAEVQYALIRNFARQTPINVVSTFIAVTFTAWMVSPFVPGIYLWPWVVAHLGLFTFLFALWVRRYLSVRSGAPPRPRSAQPLEARIHRARLRAIIIALLSGVMWGLTAAALPFLPDKYQVALVIIVGGMAGGSTTTLSGIPQAAALYAFTAIIPFSVYFFEVGADPASITIGVLAMFMAIAMIWASRSVHGTFLDDVAARVAATKALEDLRSAREDWLQVAQSTDAFALFDEHKLLKFRNQAFVDLLTGPDQRAPFGAAWADLIERLAPSEEIGIGLVTREERLQRYLRQEHEPDEPLIERLADGRWLRSVMRHTESGSLLWLIQDITAERNRESVEIKLRARLAESKQLQTIGQFASGVAHDFNNVLGAIQAFAHYIADHPTANDVQGPARRIISACERGAGMVRNIMQLATASRVHNEPFKFANAFQQAVNLLPSSKPETADFIAEDLTAEATIDANESQIVQLIMNLVLNAFASLKRTAGKVSLRAARIDVDVATASQFFDAASGRDSVAETPDGSYQFVFGMLLPDKPYIKITVEDSGSGIEPSFLSRIFDPFVSTKDTTMRTGFGLAVVRSVVLASEGALAVHSRLGRGTTFEVYLAVVPPPRAETGARPLATTVPTPRHILIVDDDVDGADGLALALRGLGHETLALYDPRAALDVVNARPDAWPVMVIDMAMPGMNGDELAVSVHRASPLTRLFLYTGRNSEALRATAAKIGVEAVLQKPVDPHALSELIGRRE